MKNLANFTRFKRLLDARRMGADEAAKVEHAIAQELVGQDVLDRDVQTRATAHPDMARCRVFEAAELLSGALDAHLPRKAKGKYDPKFSHAKTVEDIWCLRQTIDSLGMRYDSYVGNALQHVGRPNERSPRLSQLMHRDVVSHVASEWVRKM